MEPAPKLTGRSFEEQRTYKIEHFPGFDMVVNLDYPDASSINSLLNILQENTSLSFYRLVAKIKSYPEFFVKKKDNIGRQLATVKAIKTNKYNSKEDPIAVFLRDDFNTESRYARISILSEIILSKKVKEIICSAEVQELARRYGFYSMDFAEPITGIVYNNHRGRKFLVYKNISNTRTMPVNFYLGDFSKDLRKIFVKNGIQPSDLRNDQFIFTIDSHNGYKITLIDIEAYTEIKK
jgi:hypothetical protein